MIVRREEDGLRRYAMGTGNYHPRTTLYTDFGLLTANAEIGEDVATVFKQLTGLGQGHRAAPPVAGPFTLQAQRGRGDPARGPRSRAQASAVGDRRR